MQGKIGKNPWWNFGFVMKDLISLLKLNEIDLHSSNE